MIGIFDENRNSGDWMMASLNAVADCDGMEDSADALLSMTKALVYSSLANAAATRELAALLSPNETFSVQLEEGDEQNPRLIAEGAAAMDADFIEAPANAQSNLSATQRAINAVNLVEKSAESGAERLTDKEVAERWGVGTSLVKGVRAAQRMDEDGVEGGGWMSAMVSGEMTATAMTVARTLHYAERDGDKFAAAAIAWRKRENATWDAAKKRRASLLDDAKRAESERKAVEMALAEAKSDAETVARM